MLHEALKHWKELGFTVKPKLIDVFDKGLNHYCGLLESGGDKFVIKVFTHSFERAIEAEYLGSEAHVSPTILSAANNIAVYQYIPNRRFKDSDLAHLCASLKATHSIKPIAHQGLNHQALDLLSVCDSYLVGSPSRLQQYHLQLLALLKEFTNDTTPLVFCHNDLVQENCLFDEQQAWFIDWEFAQVNNPWFDLASIMLYFNLDNTQADVLLQSYFDNKHFHSSSRLCVLAKLCVLWCDLLWQVHTKGLKYIERNEERFKALEKMAKTLNVELRVKH